MAITIENVAQSNLDLLNNQEMQLIALLDKIRKAKSLFSGTEEKVARRTRRTRRTKPAKVKSTVSSKPGRKSKKSGRSGTYMEDVVTLLQKNGKMKSGDLIKTIAQKRGKDYKKLQFSIYPVLTQAFKANKLGKSNGFYTLK
jgi:hypothetical protein